jgi:hypothetical protein
LEGTLTFPLLPPWPNTSLTPLPQYYFLFIFWDIFEFIFIYFFFIETRRRTLEEIGEIFKSRKPVKTSLSKTRIIMHGGNRGVTEMLDKEEEPGMGSQRARGRFEMVGFGNGRG